MKLKGERFKELDKVFEKALDEYFDMLDGRKSNGLHKLVFTRLEKELLNYVLKRENYNQSKACTVLGISRDTLRTKLRNYNIHPSKR